MAIHKDDWITLVNLKDAYSQIQMGQPYQFSVLCFGLPTTPQVFTRMMTPTAAALPKKEVCLLLYLHEWLLLAALE